MKKAKKQVAKLEALTAQTKEGSAREEKMKNITAKAKERLADVEKKVNKQLNKEMNAKSELTKAEIKFDKAKEDYLAKKEDNAEVRENKLASEGRIKSRPGSHVKSKLHQEGLDAIAYMKYVNESSDAFAVYHRTPEDPREWKKPKDEREYDIEEDDDPEIYNNKKVKKSMKKIGKSKKFLKP